MNDYKQRSDEQPNARAICVLRRATLAIHPRTTTEYRRSNDCCFVTDEPAHAIHSYMADVECYYLVLLRSLVFLQRCLVQYY